MISCSCVCVYACFYAWTCVSTVVCKLHIYVCIHFCIFMCDCGCECVLCVRVCCVSVRVNSMPRVFLLADVAGCTGNGVRLCASRHSCFGVCLICVLWSFERTRSFSCSNTHDFSSYLSLLCFPLICLCVRVLLLSLS